MADVRRATSGDRKAIATMFTRSFHDDPVWMFLFPDADRRDGQAISLFNTYVRAHLGDDETLVSDGVTGAAVWAPPGRWRIPLSKMVPEMPRLARAFRGRAPGLLVDLQRLEKFHATFTREAHFYLAVLGTDPPHQGHGVGSALMAPVLERCDHAGLGAYLESSKESNVPFYRRHGFEVAGEFTFRNGPTMWPMWREPRPPET